ncbi:MAG: hypothetical protein MRY78_03680 [Saprospiraceae bacterium]|nr:hypothetical protein [Saprospiraceae bacterium]
MGKANKKRAYRIVVQASDEHKQAIDQIVKDHADQIEVHQSEEVYEGVYQVVIEMERSYHDTIQRKVKKHKGAILKLNKREREEFLNGSGEE